MEAKYDMNLPIAWKDFKFWPRDAQREYIQEAKEKYHVTIVLLANMFGVAASSLSGYCHSKLGLYLNSGPLMTQEDRENWDKFLLGWASPSRAKLNVKEYDERMIKMGDTKWHAMRFDEFKQMTIQDQTEFIQYLQSKYHASLKYIAQMMGTSESTLSKYRKDNLPDVQFTGYKMTRGQKTKFYEFTGSGNTAVQNAITKANTKKEVSAPTCEEAAFNSQESEESVNNMAEEASIKYIDTTTEKTEKIHRIRSFNFGGEFTSEEILDALVSLVGRGEVFHGNFTITCEMY